MPDKFVQKFCDIFYKGNPPSKNKRMQRLQEEAEKLLNHPKWDRESAENVLYQYRRAYPNSIPSSISQVFKQLKDNDMIINPTKFYYHNELRRMPPPPKSKINRDGSIEIVVEEFYLEIKGWYTKHDLFDYASNKLNISTEQYSREIGALDYLVSKYGLDVVLYSIDAALEHCSVMDRSLPKACMDISDYIEDGRIRYENKKAEAKANGLDKPLPKTAN